MTAPARLLLAASLTMAHVGRAQETVPAPAPESQPEKPAPAPTKPPEPGNPKGTPVNPGPAAPPATPAPDQPAGEAPEGRKLFLAASEAIKKAQAISYRAKSYAEGPMLSNYMSKSQADVRMLRTSGGWLIRSTGSGSSMSTKGDVEFDMSWLGPHNEWVDHTAKKVFEKTVKDTKGPAVGIAPSAKVEELIELNPFSAEIAAPEYILEGQRDHGGVMCDVVVAMVAGKKKRWMLGVDDHLPRWRERVIEGTAAAGSMIVDISNIKADTDNPPRMTPEMLHVTVPEGYTEDRVPPAPPPPPPAPVPDKSGAPTDKPAPAITPAGPPPPPPAPPAPLVLKAPDFDLKESKGQNVPLASLKGNVVVLEFGGTWCLPLRDAHPELETFTKDYHHLPVKVFMLDVREKVRSNAVDDITKGSYSFGLLLDADPVAKAYNIKKYPTYVVIDKEGNLSKTEAGFKKIETINAVRDAVNHLTGSSIAKPEVPVPPPTPAKTEDKPATPEPKAATPGKVAPVFKPAPKK